MGCGLWFDRVSVLTASLPPQSQGNQAARGSFPVCQHYQLESKRQLLDDFCDYVDLWWRKDSMVDRLPVGEQKKGSVHLKLPGNSCMNSSSSGRSRWGWGWPVNWAHEANELSSET